MGNEGFCVSSFGYWKMIQVMPRHFVLQGLSESGCGENIPDFR
jgi:hypothetical protein